MYITYHISNLCLKIKSLPPRHVQGIFQDWNSELLNDFRRCFFLGKCYFDLQVLSNPSPPCFDHKWIGLAPEDIGLWCSFGWIDGFEDRILAPADCQNSKDVETSKSHNFQFVWCQCKRVTQNDQRTSWRFKSFQCVSEWFRWFHTWMNATKVLPVGQSCISSLWQIRRKQRPSRVICSSGSWKTVPSTMAPCAQPYISIPFILTRLVQTICHIVAPILRLLQSNPAPPKPRGHRSWKAQLAHVTLNLKWTQCTSLC